MKLAALALALVVLPATIHGSSCPVVFLKDGCSSAEQSTCWSPGELDVDCPNNGLCCFNGCTNQCGLPTKAVVPQGLPPQVWNKPQVTTTTPKVEVIPTTKSQPQCQVVFVDRQETVEKEMCTEVPVCKEIPSKECDKKPKQICTDKPCFPQDKLEEFKTTECKNTTEQCSKVPEKQCNNVTEKVCNGTVQKCTQIVMSGADCGCKTVCSLEDQLQCSKPKTMMGKWKRSAEVLSRTKRTYGSYRRWNYKPTSYYRGTRISNPGRYYGRANGYRKSYPVATTTTARPMCVNVKVKTCKEVPYPDTHKCTAKKCKEVPACRDITRPECTVVERKQCTPARQICTEVTKNRVVQSTAHCPEVPAQTCTQVFEEVCKVVKRRQCEQKKQCNKVPKTVTYQVPQEVCQ